MCIPTAILLLRGDEGFVGTGAGDGCFGLLIQDYFVLHLYPGYVRSQQYAITHPYLIM